MSFKNILEEKEYNASVVIRSHDTRNSLTMITNDHDYSHDTCTLPLLSTTNVMQAEPRNAQLIPAEVPFAIHGKRSRDRVVSRLIRKAHDLCIAGYYPNSRVA